MVITVSCPSCATAFPVDPAKIPAAGVKARCSTCGHVFRVEKPGSAAPAPTPSPPAAPKAAAPAPSMPAPRAAPPPLPPPPPAAEESASLDDIEIVPPPAPPRPAPPAAPKAAPPPPKPAAPAARPPAPAAPTPSAPAAGGTFRFGKRDPTDKAKRLARVLVSDMIMYNAERHRTALENGTLADDFQDEIAKSWKEYVEQVGAEMADGDGRGFWREALNDILAKGQPLF